MSRSSLYPDIKAIFDEAIASSGGVYVCATHKAALAWRLRAYRFRRAYFDETGDARYDQLSLPKPEDNEVHINKISEAGFFVPKIAPGDALAAVADDLIRKLGQSDDIV